MTTQRTRIPAPLFHSLLDIFPSPLFVVDEDVRIQLFNIAAEPLLGPVPEQTLNRRGGDAVQCTHHFEVPEGCGHSTLCSDCVIRGSVGEAFAGKKVTRAKTRMDLRTSDGQTRSVFLLVTAAPFEFDGLKRALLIIEDISSLTELRSLLPICSYCHKIRTDGDYWQRVETYLSRQLDTDITHGICPTCLEKVKKDLDQTKKTWRQAEGGGPESG